MDPLSGLITGGASLIGGLIANNQNKAMIQQQEAFQERMSNTSYQRAVKDMQLAGINPMLAYMQGGASSPGGASTTMENVVGPAVSTALASTRLKQDMLNMYQERQKMASEQGLNQRLGIKVEKEQDLLDAQREGQIIDNRLKTLQIPGAQNRATFNRWLGRLRDQPGQTTLDAARWATDQLYPTDPNGRAPR